MPKSELIDCGLVHKMDFRIQRGSQRKRHPIQVAVP
jgi:hypothetical protein